MGIQEISPSFQFNLISLRLIENDISLYAPSYEHSHCLKEASKESEEESLIYCSGCLEQVLFSYYECVQHCGFYLHKRCAMAPFGIQHPLHDHRLQRCLPSPHDEQKTVYCNFCCGEGKGFMYHCHICKFYLHMKCSFFPCETLGNLVQIQSITHPHALTLIGNSRTDDQRCSGCSDPLVDDSYMCLLCDLYFDKKCAELPIEISHPYHRKHQLILKLRMKGRVCDICESDHHGFFYHCSLCNVDIQTKCASPLPFIEDKNHHQHPFSPLCRPNSFTCDGCGTQGNDFSYVCSTCNLQVHKKCISLPLFIGINLHHHAISRKFFVSLPQHQHDSKTWDCRICYQEVKMEYGSYFCSQPNCNFVVHVNYAIENRSLYDVIELKNQDEVDEHDAKLALLRSKSMDCIKRVIKQINVGEEVIAEEIEHISHKHNLILSKEIKDNKHCNGCCLPISSSFYYYCSQCDFFLHKDCAELPSTGLLWYDSHPFTLHTNGIFKCGICRYVCGGFSYRLADYYSTVICLRCAAVSHSFTYQAHEPHYLFYDKKYRGLCSACGGDRDVVRRCKDCDFALDMRCLTLPRTAWHKCDEHSLKLVHGDYNDYPLQHFCDICEETREPKHWSYHCEVCDTSVHPKCVLGEPEFVKLGSNCSSKKHPHPLTFVEKIYDYCQCVECDKPCEDLALKCLEHGCNYIVHWKCANPVIS